MLVVYRTMDSLHGDDDGCKTPSLPHGVYLFVSFSAQHREATPKQQQQHLQLIEELINCAVASSDRADGVLTRFVRGGWQYLIRCAERSPLRIRSHCSRTHLFSIPPALLGRSFRDGLRAIYCTCNEFISQWRPRRAAVRMEFSTDLSWEDGSI